MAALLRRALLPLVLVTVVAPVFAGLSAQQQLPPEAAALTAAARLTDPAAKLAALEKIRADFPAAGNLNIVDSQILATLVNSFPDRLPAITDVFDRIVARIPADAPADTRMTQTLAPVNVVVGKKLLLEKSDALMASIMTGLDESKYADVQRANAARLSLPEPAADVLKTRFGTLRSRGLEAQARIASARGDAAAAERLYCDAVDLNAAFGPPVIALVDIYTARKEFDKAEAVLQASIKAAAASPALASRPTLALVDLYEKQGQDAKLEALLRDTLAKNPTVTGVGVRLARLEARRGNDAAALDLFLGAAAQGSMIAADDALMRAAYRNTHSGSDAGLDDLIDKTYKEKFPNPVTAEPYVPPAGRTDRLVLLEMFTGSACGPCVSADLALDAVMERYPPGTIVPVAYHQHIPGPDPMVTSGSQTRNTYYSVRGVPTFNIDGALGRLGGGPRTNTAATYKDYTSKIDKALLVPATAALSVSATGEGNRIVVTADVTKLPADAKDLRLHLLIVERHLRFTGENGIRFHPMVVRGSAGEKGTGIPISSTGRTEHTFSLNEIRDDITKSLAADIERRRKTEAPGSTPREYAADGRPYVTINTADLSVVAFIQQGAYQAAPGPAAAAGIESAVETVTQLGSTVTPPPAAGAAARPAAAAPVANVLQSAIADVVFASRKGS